MAVREKQVATWLEELDAIEREVPTVTAGLTDAQWNWRPAPGKWSVGECVAHLGLVGGLVLNKLEPILTRARAEGLVAPGPYRLGFVGEWFTRTMETPGKRRMPSPKNFVPPSAVTREEALARWRAGHTRLRAALTFADGLALDRIRMGSAAKGGALLRLRASAWFASTLAHERRHLGQMRRVGGAPGFPR